MKYLLILDITLFPYVLCDIPLCVGDKVNYHSCGGLLEFFLKMNEISLVPHRQKYIHYFGYIVDSHSLYWPLGSGNFVRGGGPIWP